MVLGRDHSFGDQFLNIAISGAPTPSSTPGCLASIASIMGHLYREIEEFCDSRRFKTAQIDLKFFNLGVVLP